MKSAKNGCIRIITVKKPVKNKMRECCKSFFETDGLHGMLNIPMQFCPYCGHQLIEKDFSFYNKFNKNLHYLVGYVAELNIKNLKNVLYVEDFTKEIALDKVFKTKRALQSANKTPYYGTDDIKTKKVIIMIKEI